MKLSADKEIQAKAFFISGSDSRFREAADLLAISAVKDAKEFLASLPLNTDKPLISAGTASDPDKFVSFTWLINGYPTIKTVSVSCKGNGNYDASWTDQKGERFSFSSINFSELMKFDIAARIKHLKEGRFNQTSLRPTLS